MSEQELSVSVIILTRNRLYYLQRCIASVQRARAYVDSCEVVVVVNGEDAVSLAYLKTFDTIRTVALQLPLSRGAARNTAIGQSKGSVVYFIDDDVELPPGTLSCLVAKCREYPQHAIIGGANLGLPEEPLFQRCSSLVLASPLGAGPFFKRYARLRSDFKATVCDLIACNLAIRRQVFQFVSFPDGVAAHEENMLIEHALAQGFTAIYVAEMYVHHFRGHTVGDVFRKYMRYGEGRSDNYWMHCSPLLLTLYIITAFFLTLMLWTYLPLSVISICIAMYLLSIVVNSVYLLSFVIPAEYLRAVWLLPFLFVVLHVGYIGGFCKQMIYNFFRQRTIRSFSVKPLYAE